MKYNTQIIPKDHPNRLGWKLEALDGYVIHSTANLWPGAGDEWHAKFFAREYIKNASGVYEKDGKAPFRIASTHVVADDDSITQILPFEEFAAGAGDRQTPWTPELKGQRPFARVAYVNRQNWRTLQAEVCENKDSIWEVALNNVCDWIIEDATTRGKLINIDVSKNPSVCIGPPRPGYVYVNRHGDLTGKNCPSRLMADQGAWEEVIDYIADAVNHGRKA